MSDTLTLVVAVLGTVFFTAIGLLITFQAMKKDSYVKLAPTLLLNSSPGSLSSALYFYDNLNHDTLAGLWAFYLLTISSLLSFDVYQKVIAFLQKSPSGYRENLRDYDR